MSKSWKHSLWAGVMGLISFAFWVITIIASIEIAWRWSVVTGTAGFIACFLCYWGGAGFAGTVISRRQIYMPKRGLAMVGILSSLVLAAGVALMWWSWFRLTLFGVLIPGVAWALIGAFLALVLVLPKDWIGGNISPKTGRPVGKG